MAFPHTATVRRLIASGAKYVYGDAGTTPCFKQPIDETTAQLFGMTFSKGSVAYIPLASDVKEADELVIGGVKYGVRGISSRDYGALAHKKAVLEQL